MTFAVLLAAILLALLAAPLYASEIAGTGPDENHLTDQIVIDGEPTDVISEDGVPIGPTWTRSYFIGADENGRDLMVRLLYRGLCPLRRGDLPAPGRRGHDRGHDRDLRPAAGGRAGHVPGGRGRTGQRDRGHRGRLARPPDTATAAIDVSRLRPLLPSML
jgi:hypothetical protein